MGKFVVIDKEKVERSEHSELIKTAISLLIKHGVATELSTDESIETVIEKILQPNVGICGVACVAPAARHDIYTVLSAFNF